MVKTDSENISETKMYCGRGPVPRGKVRGTAEYCLRNNQVRYYGLVAIDKKLLDMYQGKATSLIKEQLKLKKIENEAKILIKEVKNIKVILDNEELKQSRRKQVQKKLDNLLLKRDKLVKKLRDQRQVIHTIEKEEKRADKEAKKAEKEANKTKKEAKKKETSKKKN